MAPNSTNSKKPAAQSTAAKNGKNATAVGRTFAQMLDNKKFTSRVLQKQLRMSSRTVNNAKVDPGVLSLGDVFRLADLMKEPVELLMQELVAEIKQLPAELQPVQ
ncbi:helix-turn-helix domain-containing protein [Hymenobacter sp. J193]|uniref:helix-turn-helix domain-containing protein n=1 Tax=Hymenobacter sp. J193 TaxID=2898429 RepID=UPI002151A251|nr:helix-turn-helix domain-containing protein [Hymenobacter sp. J193]MCR5890349.1 helix-turn-helix domain-containing protein [Hymenobacter sp. J193]